MSEEQDRCGGEIGLIEEIMRRGVNPSTFEHFVSIDPSVPQATMYSTINQMVKDKKLYDCGPVKRRGRGRPSKLFATWKVQSTLREHELGLTNWLDELGLLDAPILRGPHVSQQFLPDATIQTFPVMHIEWDTGSESTTKVREHMERWRDSDEFVIFVARTKQRLDNLYDSFEGLESVLFMTFKNSRKAEDMYGVEKPLEYLLKNAGRSRD